MTISHALILLLVGLTSGLMNSLAGGGSFVLFPTLVFLGLQPIAANATATLALLPGTFTTMYTYRKNLVVHNKQLITYIAISIAGGAFGAMLLLRTSNTDFAKMVPYLLLTATLLFTFRMQILLWIRKISRNTEPDSLNNSLPYRIIMMILFVAICIYGGFFGAGMGIMTLALFSLMGMQNLHEMNALRSCIGLCANVIAALMFCTSGVIAWQHALIVAIGAVFGGYFGAYYALKLPQSWSRNAVVIIGWVITIYFFRKNLL